jgi:hypothetical protein
MVARILQTHEIVLSRPQHKVSSPDLAYLEKKAIEDQRTQLKADEVFYYAHQSSLDSHSAQF